jgi:hypothetical protein
VAVLVVITLIPKALLSFRVFIFKAASSTVADETGAAVENDKIGAKLGLRGLRARMRGTPLAHGACVRALPRRGLRRLASRPLTGHSDDSPLWLCARARKYARKRAHSRAHNTGMITTHYKVIIYLWWGGHGGIQGKRRCLCRTNVRGRCGYSSSSSDGD